MIDLNKINCCNCLAVRKKIHFTLVRYYALLNYDYQLTKPYSSRKNTSETLEMRLKSSAKLLKYLCNTTVELCPDKGRRLSFGLKLLSFSEMESKFISETNKSQKLRELKKG